MTAIHAVPTRGDRIKNGAVIVDIKPAWDSSGYIALCLWTEDTQSTPHKRTVDPYVTWFIRPEGEHVIASNGHYHDQLSEAVVDFNNRI